MALAIAEGQDVDDEVADQAQDHFEAFYEEVFEELSKFGEIEEIVCVDNIGEHTHAAPSLGARHVLCIGGHRCVHTCVYVTMFGCTITCLCMV